MNNNRNSLISTGEFFDKFRQQTTTINQIDTQNEHTNNKIASNNEDDTQPVTSNTEHNTPVERGSMPTEAKRALVSLLRFGVILASQKIKLFETICHYKTSIDTHLADVYLKLILDQPNGVAYVEQMNDTIDEDDEVSPLIIKRPLSVYDTILLLVLRKYYQERETAGEKKIIVDIERIETFLSPFLPLTNSSKSDRRTLTISVNRMKERHILATVRGCDDRFEITPIIRYIVNAAFLESMLQEYQKLSQAAQSGNVIIDEDQPDE